MDCELHGDLAYHVPLKVASQSPPPPSSLPLQDYFPIYRVFIYLTFHFLIHFMYICDSWFMVSSLRKTRFEMTFYHHHRFITLLINETNSIQGYPPKLFRILMIFSIDNISLQLVKASIPLSEVPA